MEGLCKNYALPDVDLDYVQRQGTWDSRLEEGFNSAKFFILKHNSDTAFSNQEEYCARFGKYDPTIGLITRKFGFELEGREILEIGPVGYIGYVKGSDNLKLLKEMGAKVYWLDPLLPVEGEPDDFQQGSWTQIHRIYKNKFDAIFVERMYPEFLDEYKIRKDTPFLQQLELLERTLSCLKDEDSMFFNNISFNFYDMLLSLPYAATKELLKTNCYELYYDSQYVQLFDRE